MLRLELHQFGLQVLVEPGLIKQALKLSLAVHDQEVTSHLGLNDAQGCCGLGRGTSGSNQPL